MTPGVAQLYVFYNYFWTRPPHAHPQDLAVYQILGQLATLEIAEMCARSGANCGSLFLDLRFRELVRTLLADHPAHLDAASLAYFMHSFSETEKITYRGDVDDGDEHSLSPRSC